MQQRDLLITDWALRPSASAHPLVTQSVVIDDAVSVSAVGLPSEKVTNVIARGAT